MVAGIVNPPAVSVVAVVINPAMSRHSYWWNRCSTDEVVSIVAGVGNPATVLVE